MWTARLESRAAVVHEPWESEIRPSRFVIQMTTLSIMNPTQLGPYTIQSRLGRGGMGAVYEAVDTTTGDTVAVKVLASHLADDDGVRSRFEAEIDALKNLRHPGIVRLLAFGEQDDQPFFAMELVRGRSLEQILRGGRRFNWRETIAVAIEVSRALKAAHDQGIVHRDLKPANLLVADASPVAAEAGVGDARDGIAAARGGTDPGGSEKVTVKLADFGIAKLFGGVGHTALGHVVGTAEYMAPEQAAGRPVDHRVDLYALGLVMYAMLTGSPPFRGTQLTEVIDKQRRAIPPRVASLAPDIPAELDELIARLLAKDPAQRPASALALVRLLSAIETLHPLPGSSGGTPPAPAEAATQDHGGAHGPTAHQRSNRPTRPIDAIDPTVAAHLAGKDAPRAAAPAALDADLLAPTQPLQVPVVPPTRSRTVPPGKPPAAQAPPGQTRHGQSARGRIPSSQQTGDHRPVAGSLDITQDITGRDAAQRMAAPATPADPSRLPTGFSSATTQVDRSDRNRFTTVAEFEQTAAAKVRREQFWQSLWQGLTAVAVMATMAGAGWFLLKPLSADQVYERIMAVVNDEHGDRRDSRSDIDLFLGKHASDPRADQIRELKRTLDLDVLERRARRRVRSDKELAPLEREYRAAMTNEENGPSACVKSLEAMLAVHGTDPLGDDESRLWLDLTRRKVDQLRPQALAEQRDDGKRIGELLADAQSLAARADIANDDDARKRFTFQRRTILENVIEVYAKRPHAAEAVAFAKRELGDRDDEPATPTPTPPADGIVPNPAATSAPGSN